MARDDPRRRARRGAAERALAADAKAAQAMAPYRHLPWLEPLADLGDQPQLRTLCASMIAAGLAAGRDTGWGPHLARAGLRMLIAHQAATMAKNFVKYRIDRTRPRSRHRAGADHRPRPGGGRAKEETSFPSGHAAGAAAVAAAFAREFPAHRVAAAAAGGALSLVQVPRCAHYPSDIAVGAAIGLLAEKALAMLWSPSPAARTRSDEPEMELSPCGY